MKTYPNKHSSLPSRKHPRGVAKILGTWDKVMPVLEDKRIESQHSRADLPQMPDLTWQFPPSPQKQSLDWVMPPHSLEQISKVTYLSGSEPDLRSQLLRYPAPQRNDLIIVDIWWTSVHQSSVQTCHFSFIFPSAFSFAEPRTWQYPSTLEYRIPHMWYLLSWCLRCCSGLLTLETEFHVCLAPLRPRLLDYLFFSRDIQGIWSNYQGQSNSCTFCPLAKHIDFKVLWTIY